MSLLEHYLQDQDNPEAQRLKSKLRDQIAQIPTDSFTVERAMPQIEDAWEDHFWRRLTSAKINLLRTRVVPLLRYAAGTDVAATTFTNKVERLNLYIHESRDTGATIRSLQDDVDRLPSFVSEQPQRQAAIDFALSRDIEVATSEDLEELIEQLSDQMRYKRKEKTAPLPLDLRDRIETRGLLSLIELAKSFMLRSIASVLRMPSPDE